ncbi:MULTISPECIES: hypothetical protein [unclassified Agarivorans]|uniref:hypothetical protein n=1 Tax=unclassified Agarivorans TaxID=2636026 RepID=UPI0026E39A07|nr:MULTISPECIES: hypothetical protein [unclassified Agarivorans]MDO6686414.1 hypothetical protein [Agarivorans sp. 3_MG-2023]MDO6713716.1 hypothetical protein [Agarivorans sp. 2_MG-2023]
MTLTKRLILSLLLMSMTACASTLTSVKLKVVDQDGLPVENAEVFLGFILGNEGANVKELTDKNGELKATRRQNLGVIVRVNKEGYYQSKLRTGPSDQNLTIELRKKKTPTAMYAKKLTLRFPKKKTAIGFDFEQADWVAPYGKGNIAHVFFYLDGQFISTTNYSDELRISFSNPEDGLIKLTKNSTASEYQFPYLASQDNYQNGITLKSFRSGSDKVTDYDQFALGYTFRVNTEVNSEGEVIHANYGKISGDIWASAAESKKKKSFGFIRFTYYYNPTPNDHSLEFDWRQNLFRDLEHEEKVYEP